MVQHQQHLGFSFVDSIEHMTSITKGMENVSQGLFANSVHHSQLPPPLKLPTYGKKREETILSLLSCLDTCRDESRIRLLAARALAAADHIAWKRVPQLPI